MTSSSRRPSSTQPSELGAASSWGRNRDRHDPPPESQASLRSGGDRDDAYSVTTIGAANVAAAVTAVSVAAVNFRAVLRHAAAVLRSPFTAWRRALRERDRAASPLQLPPALMRRDRHSTVSTRALDLQGWSPVVFDGTIVTLLPCFRLLVSLHMPGCAAVSTKCWLSLFASVRHLTSLTVSGSPGVTDAVVQRVAVRCPDLATLDVGSTSIGSPALNTLVDSCVRVRHLVIRDCVGVTDARCLVRLVHLAHLDASGAHGLVWSSLRSLATYCRQLHHLDVSTTAISYTELVLLLGGNPGEAMSTQGFDTGRLTYLGLRRCPGITTAGLSFVFRHSPSHMRCLDLADGNHVSAFALSSLATYCRRVTSLRFPRCGLNDEHLRCLASGCRNLVELDLSHNVSITNEGLFAIAPSCPTLVTLNLSGCGCITDEGILAVVTAACTPEQRRNQCVRIGASTSQSSCDSLRGGSAVRAGHSTAAHWAATNHVQVLTHAATVVHGDWCQ